MRIVITGGSGLIGSHLVKQLKKKYKIVLFSRNNPKLAEFKFFDLESFGNQDFEKSVSKNLRNIDVILHLAGLSTNPKGIVNGAANNLYKSINTYPTIKFAQLANKAGVKLFIFMSSAKVNGDFSHKNKPFGPLDKASPSGPYALSKYLAEEGLRELSKNSKMKTAIIRPPLTLGEGLSGGLKILEKLIKIGAPLPFKNINNKRAIISNENLSEFIIELLNCEERLENFEILMVANNNPISSEELIRKIAKKIKSHVILFPFPKMILKILLFLIGKSNISNSMFKNFEVDISETTRKINWRPKD